MSRTLILKKTVSTSAKRLVVSTETPDGSVDEYVFKFFRKPTNPLDNSGIMDVFVSVCTASDLQTLPIEGPDDDSDYFRAKIVDITYLTSSDAIDGWEDLYQGVQDLVEELKANDRMGVEEQTYAGDAINLFVRYHTTNAVIVGHGLIVQHWTNMILKDTLTLTHYAEAAIGDYDEYELVVDFDAVLLGDVTISHECRCTIMQQITLTHTADAIVGQVALGTLVSAVLKKSGLTKIHNSNSILKKATPIYHTADVRLV